MKISGIELRKDEPREDLSNRTPGLWQFRSPRQALIGNGLDGKVEFGTPDLRIAIAIADPRVRGRCLVGNRNGMTRLGKAIRGVESES